MSDRPEHEDTEVDFEGRTLCPDGNCTGVIGVDGRCPLCGRSASGEAPPAPARTLEDTDSEDVERALCPDGSCIGLVDPTTGRCKVCGLAIAQ